FLLPSKQLLLRKFRPLLIGHELFSFPILNLPPSFGWCPDDENARRTITGVNWSPAIGNPFRGAYGESLDSILAHQRSGLRAARYAAFQHVECRSWRAADHRGNSCRAPKATPQGFRRH